MTCCECWTTCNGVCLLIFLLLGIVFNSLPLVFNLVEKDAVNPVSCFEWWFPGIIGAGLMALPATAMALAAGKRACCNNRIGMFLSSLFNVFTILGAVYCMLVSLQALMKGPLICNSQANSTVNCEFSVHNISDIDINSLNLKWFIEKSCVSSDSQNYIDGDITAGGGMQYSWDFDTKEGKHKTIHLSAYLGLLITGIFEVLFALSQILIGFLGCLCGVSKQRNQYV